MTRYITTLVTAITARSTNQADPTRHTDPSTCAIGEGNSCVECARNRPRRPPRNRARGERAMAGRTLAAVATATSLP